jgi:ribosomal protein L37AE/L43A
MGVLRVRICPNCGSEDVAMVAGGMTGTWMCKKCGFSGSVFPEKELIDKDLDEGEENNDT